jgi:hypothetical protein
MTGRLTVTAADQALVMHGITLAAALYMLDTATRILLSHFRVAGTFVLYSILCIRTSILCKLARVGRRTARVVEDSHL